MRDDAVLRHALPLGRGLGRVRWTNLQPSGVTFPQESVYQKLLKSVHV